MAGRPGRPHSGQPRLDGPRALLLLGATYAPSRDHGEVTCPRQLPNMLISALPTTPMITDDFVDLLPRFALPKVFGALPDEKRGEHSRREIQRETGQSGRTRPTPASHVAPEAARGRVVDHRGPVQNCRKMRAHATEGGHPDNAWYCSVPPRRSTDSSPPSRHRPLYWDGPHIGLQFRPRE